MPLTKQPDRGILIHACRQKWMHHDQYRGGVTSAASRGGGVRYLRVLSLLLSHSPRCNLLNILKI